ncbi:c-type cytochrome [Sorangium atrum]|uniref:C-type cytochrome n=1 Tax=Sorangium atrum TaxID=2995308 RepID=A0ABT5CCK3_9BACT|nr:c-type cytochrome [Sorangium aterium]MDC0684163.1 c-type cytochrome [Sorangium aterium]
MRARPLLALLAALASGAAGCTSEDARGSALAAPPPASDGGAGANAPAAAAALAGDPARGERLVAEFQCNRCHDGTGHAPAARDAHCVQCHQDIAAGRFQAPAAAMKRWNENLVQLRDVPSLAAAGDRLRRDWIRGFLLSPHDVRPRLHATMPRLAIGPEQASDIAAYLTRERRERPTAPLEGASAARGRELYEAKGCGTCHAFSGTTGLTAVAPVKGMEKETRAAIALAPDLRHARDRMEPADLAAWVLDPAAIKPGTPMPQVPMSPTEARDLAAFITTAELSPRAPASTPERLPLLSRRVTYAEVDRRVFRVTCRHCHSEPDYALGDGGPGNTGGFGFKPRGLNLATYEGIAAGYVDDQGERRSVFSRGPDGAPRLVAALLARQAEEAGRAAPAVRGMPLGLPAVGPEEIQLVESWIAQGRPQ